MGSSKKMEFEGKDIAEAISKACKALNVSQEDLDIEVLTTGTSGIFGLLKQKARLRVAVKKEHGDQAEPVAKIEEKPRRQAKPRGEKPKSAESRKETPAREKKKEERKEERREPSAAVQAAPPERAEVFQVEEALLEQVKTDLSRLLELINYPSDVTVSSDREHVTALIQGQYVNEIVEQNGKILDSLQYLLRKMIAKRYSEKAIISLDAGGFRETRTEELKQQALELAAEVKSSGKTRSIPSLNPSERRVVHLALQDDKDVRSRSVGEGLFKKVLVYLPGKGRKGPARKRRGGKGKK